MDPSLFRLIANKCTVAILGYSRGKDDKRFYHYLLTINLEGYRYLGTSGILTPNIRFGSMIALRSHCWKVIFVGVNGSRK